MSFLNLKKILTRILQNLRRLPNYYNLNGGGGNRPTSANIDSDNSGGVIQFLSTSSMTTGRPNGDGNILQFNWDNSDKWASQLFIPHSNGGRIQFRAQTDGTTWNNWHDVYYDPMEIPANANLNSYNAPCTRYCPQNTTVATLSNCPTSSAFFLYVEKVNNPDVTTTDTYQYYTQTIKDIDGKVYIRKIQYSNGAWAYGAWGNGLPYVANNLTTSSAGTYVLDAYQGKVLNDKFSSYATTSSLNNYLPKSGGTATGDITVNHSDTTQSTLKVKNSAAEGHLYAGSGGNFGLYNSKLGHGLIVEDKDGDVSIHGWTNTVVNSQSFAAASHTYLANDAIVRRVGKVAVLSISNLTGTTNAADYTLFTLNAEFRPASGQYHDCVVAGSTPKCVRITINTNGSVVAHTYDTRSATTNINVRANIPYICVGT